MSDPTADRDPIEVLADSFLARFRRGERPSVEDYAGEHPDLADEIRELLPALVLLEQGKSAVGEATGSVGAAATSAWGPAPLQLGDYLILREVGRGGMGVVYEAVQQSLGRHVALKVLPSAGPTGSALERFRLEARSAARLHHTNIVPVFGVGEDDGVAYYAMQFIRGQGLDVVVDELRRRRERGGRPPADSGGTDQAGSLADALTLGFTAAPAEPAVDAMPAARAMTGPDDTVTIDPARPGPPDNPVQPAPGGTGLASELSTAPTGSDYHRRVARLGLQVAEALAYAHGQGVLHRDIKPSNLLLDAHGTAWVTDFGLAKAEGSDGPTRTGDVVGTLRYMAPERFDGRSDPRSDVYGLGATLYELLTLRPPFDDADRVRLIERVLRAAPERPRRADPRIPRDLETIVLKALARDPAGRYATAEAMAEDLRRFLADRPILARRATTTERAMRWCRRNPALAAASALAFAGLAAAVAILAVSNARIRERGEALRLALLEKDGALRGRTRALSDARREEERANRNATRAGAQERQARAQERLARLRFYASQVNLAGQALEDGDVARAATLLEGQRPRPGEEDLRTFEWYHLWLRTNAALVRELRGPRGTVLQVALSPDGRTLAVAQDEGLCLRDLAAGSELGRLVAAPGSICWSAAWSADGRRLATGSIDGLVRIWDPVERRIVAESRRPGWVRALAWSPDGQLLAVGSGRIDSDREVGTIDLIDPGTGDRMSHLEGHRSAVLALGFSPDGRALASGSGFEEGGGSVAMWDWRAGRRLWLREGTGAERTLDFSPDGRALVGCHGEAWMDVTLLDAADGHAKAVFEGHRSAITGVAGTPDGRTLVSISVDRTVRAWDVATGRGRILGTHAVQVRSLAITADGRRVITGDGEGNVRVWDLRAEMPPGRYDGMPVRGVGFPPDGRAIVVGGEGRTRLLDPATLAERGALPRADVVDVAPRGDRLALRGADSAHLRITDTSADGEGCIVDRRDGSFRFAPDGRTAVTFRPYVDRRIDIWDLEAGRLRETIEPPEVVSVLDVAFAPDSSGLAVGCQSRDVAVYNFAARSWRRRDVTGDHLAMVPVVAYSPDGRAIAAGLESGQVLLLEAGSLAVRARLEGHSAPILNLAFSPDGRVVASSGDDRTIRLWDPETGQERLALACERPVRRLAFSPDGHTLVGWDRESPLWVWHAADRPLATARHAIVDGLYPDSPRELEQSGYGLWASGRIDEAEAAFRRALGRLDAAAGIEPAGPEVCRLHAGVRTALALLLAESGRRDESAKEREEAIDEARGLTPDARSELASSLVDRARSLRGRGKRAPADAAMGVAAEVAPEDDADVRLALAAGEVEIGGWARAAGHFEASASLLMADANRPASEAARTGYLGALARLAAGDTDAYRAACARLLDHYADAPDDDALYWAVWACALGPGPAVDVGRLSAASHRLTGLRPASADAFQAAGGVLYRAGETLEAVRWLDEASVARGVDGQTPLSTPLYGRLFQAMALHRLGRPREARTLLTGAVAAIDADPTTTSESTPWNRRLTLRLLRAEAEAALARPAGKAHAEGLAAAGPWLRAAFGADGLEGADPLPPPVRMSEPERSALLALADRAAESDRWDEAAALLDRVVDGSPEAHFEWFRCAIARAATGDAAAYRRACRRLLDRFGAMGHPILAERTAKACLLLPLDGPELAEAVAAAERAIRSGEGHWVLPFARFARALAAYRAGDHAAAVRWADLVLAENNNHWIPDAATHLVRAMALTRLGRVAEARQALAGAISLAAVTRPGMESGNWHDGVYFDRLRVEAEALIADAGFPADPFARKP